jgi:hypothetical protein
MSQKSSVPQAVKSVSQALMPDSPAKKKPCPSDELGQGLNAFSR